MSGARAGRHSAGSTRAASSPPMPRPPAPEAARARVRARAPGAGADEAPAFAELEPAALDLVRHALDLTGARKHDDLDEMEALPAAGHRHVRSDAERAARPKAARAPP